MWHGNKVQDVKNNNIFLTSLKQIHTTWKQNGSCNEGNVIILADFMPRRFKCLLVCLSVCMSICLWSFMLALCLRGWHLYHYNRGESVTITRQYYPWSINNDNMFPICQHLIPQTKVFNSSQDQQLRRHGWETTCGDVGCWWSYCHHLLHHLWHLKDINVFIFMISLGLKSFLTHDLDETICLEQRYERVFRLYELVS